MKNLKFKKTKYLILLGIILLTNCTSAQNSHKELNGIYSRGEQTIYFNNGNCYFFKLWSENSFRKEEQYAYKYTGKKIVFKYTGNFQQEYDGNTVTKIWWRLSDDRIRDRMAYVKIESLEDWLNKRYKNIASDYAGRLFIKVKKEIPSISKLQFEECISTKNFIKYTNIEKYEMNEEFSIPEIIINIYKTLKKSNTLVNKDAAIKQKEEVKLNTKENVKWSDWAAIYVSGASSGTLVFESYFYAGKPKKANNLINFNPRRGKDIEIKYFAGLYKNGEIIGRINANRGEENFNPKSILLPNGIWGNHGSSFIAKDPTTAKTFDSWSIPVSYLKDGNYEIRVSVNEINGVIRKKIFPFKISGGSLIGDASISEKAFKKKHKLRRIDENWVMVSSE